MSLFCAGESGGPEVSPDLLAKAVVWGLGGEWRILQARISSEH